jgi:ribose-phosphate pyrophosphokinase
MLKLTRWVGEGVRAVGQEFKVKEWNFPTGESGVKIEDMGYYDFTNVNHFTINFIWEGDSSLIRLLLLVDAIRHYESKAPIHLVIPYFPYSRQDRRCHEGESHSLKVVANLINSCKFAMVTTQDAHSYVLEALIDNLVVVGQDLCAIELSDYDYVIAPDAGAAKKVESVANKVSGGKFLTCHKKREGGTVSVKLEEGTSLKNKSVVVVDDLCDGGATFLAVAKAIREKYDPSVLDLYVTHGFFTKGIDELSKQYDNIYTHNLFNNDTEVINKVEVI